MADRMQSLIVDENGVLSVRELPVPQPTPVQALVKIEACGICNGTDGKIIHRSFKSIELDQYPLILGHEAVGTVVEVGSNVKRYKVGDRVLLPYVDPIDGYGSAWGAFSEYGIVNDTYAVMESGVTPDSPRFPANSYAQNVIDPGISVLHAVMMITFREVLAATRYFGVQHGQSVAVFGCGPVGQFFTRCLRLTGAGPIFALDIVDEKLEAARACGADYVMNSKDEGFVDKIREVCPRGVEYVIDASGALEVINQSMKIIVDRGKICCYGISPHLSMQLDWSAADYNWQLIFQQMPRKIEEREALSQVLVWMEEGVINPDDFISDVYGFDHILEAFDKLEKKELKKKCIITFP